MRKRLLQFEKSDQVEVNVTDVESQIEETMLKDRHRLRQSLRRIRDLERRGKPFDRSLTRLQEQVEKSLSIRELRTRRPLKIDFPDELPISARREEIAEAIRDNQVVIICGETGSGKSTQLPKICLDLGRGIVGDIGHTQPRRLAARSVATRVAEELGNRLGDAVGFKIRFTDVTSPKTRVKLMTDGILLAETQSDRRLEQYDTIIIDEAHERSLNIDFLMGYLKRLLPKRPELKLIITSATIDAERFAEFFGSEGSPAPVINVAGRTYPVELLYRPIENDDEGSEPDWLRGIGDAVDELARVDTGDILVFLPTERDIREAARVLRGRNLFGDGPQRATEILPLYSRLSEKDQQRVFASHPHRRIVLATNVAESSLTVPGIRSVIDLGTARISRFSARSSVQRLPIEPISQASADQRKGRCGRVGPGICVRLYSEEDFLNREAFTPPEIQRCNLASVILQTQALGLGDLEDFPFLDPPKPAAIRAGYKMLYEIGALDEEQKLTDFGRKLSRLPVDPRIGRMILAGGEEQCLAEVLIIAAALEIRDPRDRPVEKQQAADQAHEQFRDENSDFLTLLKIWDTFAAWSDKLSRSQLRKACLQNFLSYNRMREWRDLERQLRDIVHGNGMKVGARSQDAERVHRAVVTGLLGNIALKDESSPEYTGSGGQKLVLWPGSAVFEKKPKWIVAAELVETNRRYARMVAPINPAWIESLAGHLVKRTHSEPHWHSRSGSVMAFEKVLLFGLPVVARRRVPYGKVEPAKAREMFIQHALVEGDYESKGKFQQYNRELKESLHDWQARTRNAGLMLGEEAEYEFYDQRIPEGIYDGPRFEKWRRKAEAENPELLHFRREDLLANPEEEVTDSEFPRQLDVGGLRLPLEYHLEPGAAEDGITIVVPQEAARHLDSSRLGWLVPGLLEEKVTALIKTLPKSIRRMFVPVPDTAREVVQRLKFGEGQLEEQLATELRRMTGEYVPVDAFDPDRLPQHLRMNVKLVDTAGEGVAGGRDVEEVQADSKRVAAQIAASEEEKRLQQTGLTDWTFGDLPEEIPLYRRGVLVTGYPMLVDGGETVGVQIALDKTEADYRTRKALIRLFWLQNADRVREQVNWLPKLDHLLAQASELPGSENFREQIGWRIAERAVVASQKVPRNADDFRDWQKLVRNKVSVAVQDIADVLGPMLTSCQAVNRKLKASRNPAMSQAYQDVESQVQQLVAPGFFADRQWAVLRHYPRYLDAILHRLKKLTQGGLAKDRKLTKRLGPYWRRYLEAASREGGSLRRQLAVEQYHWLLEEYRVSLFAQQLRTAVPVSEKRLDEAWKQVPGK
ncbi:ATP-dependent RNA helicase HrpA [Maioricimonas rarisocia]|uniref:ATP-dependent RNA helicase HrpA n=1 Tax=Maioricimonas rarisocia TaxID=2528026 RepID=UPI001E35DFAB|nr:ATP-dependent RNA helicase HrpA [Maioricimonas rarisocia]